MTHSSKTILIIIISVLAVGTLGIFVFVYPYKCGLAQGVDIESSLRIAESIDFDNDCISNADDNCPTHFNPLQVDRNRNGIGDICGS